MWSHREGIGSCLIGRTEAVSVGRSANTRPSVWLLRNPPFFKNAMEDPEDRWVLMELAQDSPNSASTYS